MTVSISRPDVKNRELTTCFCRAYRNAFGAGPAYLQRASSPMLVPNLLYRRENIKPSKRWMFRAQLAYTTAEWIVFSFKLQFQFFTHGRAVADFEISQSRHIRKNTRGVGVGKIPCRKPRAWTTHAALVKLQKWDVSNACTQIRIGILDAAFL